MSAVPVLFIISVWLGSLRTIFRELYYRVKYIHLYGTVNSILLMVYVQSSVANILSCIPSIDP